MEKSATRTGMGYWRSLPVLCMLLALAAGVFFTATEAEATHFRFGHITWRATGTNTAEITVLHAWRRSAAGALVIGNTPPAFATLSYGGGSPSSVGITGTVIFVDVANDWYLAKHVITHTYPSQGPFTASIDRSCCRISTLQNGNNDDEFLVTTDIDFRNGNTGSPVSSIPAIVQLPKTTVGNSVTFPLPTADPDLDSITCRLATSAESQLNTTAPNAGGKFLSVTSDCKLVWDTSGTAFGQLYALQVMIQEHRPNNVINDIALDFIIEIANVSLNAQPTCTVNGASSNVIAVGQNFSITVTGTDPDGGTLTVANLGLPPGATLTPASGTSPVTATFSWTPAPSDSGSAHAISVLFTDPGNLTATCSFSINVPANQPPDAQCLDQNVNTDSGVCSTASVSVNNGSSDPDGDSFTLVQTPPGSAPPTGPYSLGSTLVTLTATDSKGATDSCTATVTVADNQKPSITCPAGQTLECAGNKEASATVTATATDNCSVGSVGCSPGSGNYALGTTPVTCTATDGSNNSSSCNTSVTVVDTIPPVLTCPANQTVECGGTAVSVSATANDSCAGSLTANCSTGTVPASPVGSTTVTCSASDGTNSGSCQTTVTVVDTTAPTIACGPSQTVQTSQNPGNACSASLTPTATASDTCGAATTSCTPTALSLSSPGSASASCAATDGAGNNSTSCSVSLALIDDTAPIVSCPAPVTAECTGGGSATVTTAATAADNCAGTLPATGPGTSVYALGTTSISYSASDPSGNPASCSSSVTVQDTTAPSITCPAPVTAECTGPGGAFVTPGAASASDICAGVTVAGPAAGTYPIGTTPVTYTATDGVGLTSSCLATIEVVDTTKPVVSCVESFNPSGKNVPTANKTNQDGFYKVGALDSCSGSGSLLLKIGSYTLANGETIKLTQTPGKSGVSFVNTMGPEQIRHFQVGPGDATIMASDGVNTSSVTCLVPPPPK